jgi:hypothetical protein
MAKLTELNLDPTDGPGVKPPESEDSQRRRDMFIIQCEYLLDSERWRFAWDTVASMRDRVQAGAQPTEKMWQAVKNIEAGGRRQERSLKSWGRRYEGGW